MAATPPRDHQKRTTLSKLAEHLTIDLGCVHLVFLKQRFQKTLKRALAEWSGTRKLDRSFRDCFGGAAQLTPLVRGACKIGTVKPALRPICARSTAVVRRATQDHARSFRTTIAGGARGFCGNRSPTSAAPARRGFVSTLQVRQLERKEYIRA